MQAEQVGQHDLPHQAIGRDRCGLVLFSPSTARRGRCRCDRRSIRTGLRRRGRRERALDQRRVDHLDASGIIRVQELQRRLGGEQRAAQVVEHHDPAGRRLGQRCRDQVERRAEPAVVGAAGRDQVDTGAICAASSATPRASCAECDTSTIRTLPGMRQPAAVASARSTYAVERAPGSTCPTMRSPR